VLKFSHTNLVGGTFINVARPYGVRDLGQVGAAADFHVDTRDQPRARAAGSPSPSVGVTTRGAGRDVAVRRGPCRGELVPHGPHPVAATLALRVAGKKVWGTYPFYEAAYVGGATTVRGFVEHRFSGDAALYGNVELRLSVAKFFFLVPGELGVFGLGTPDASTCPERPRTGGTPPPGAGSGSRS